MQPFWLLWILRSWLPGERSDSAPDAMATPMAAGAMTLLPSSSREELSVSCCPDCFQDLELIDITVSDGGLSVEGCQK